MNTDKHRCNPEMGARKKPRADRITGLQDEQDFKSLLSPQGERIKVRGGLFPLLRRGPGGFFLCGLMDLRNETTFDTFKPFNSN